MMILSFNWLYTVHHKKTLTESLLKLIVLWMISLEFIKLYAFVKTMNELKNCVESNLKTANSANRLTT